MCAFALAIALGLFAIALGLFAICLFAIGLFALGLFALGAATTLWEWHRLRIFTTGTWH
jgi:hypothetical protein